MKLLHTTNADIADTIANPTPVGPSHLSLSSSSSLIYPITSSVYLLVSLQLTPSPNILTD